MNRGAARWISYGDALIWQRGRTFASCDEAVQSKQLILLHLVRSKEWRKSLWYLRFS